MAPIYTAHDQSNTRIYAGESMKQTTKTEIQSMHACNNAQQCFPNLNLDFFELSLCNFF